MSASYTVDEVMELAKGIIERRQTAEDVKALRDLLSIRNLLSEMQLSAYDPVALDHRVRNEYPVIEKIENSESFRSVVIYHGEKDWVEIITTRLSSDLYGICMDVLLKHGVVDVDIYTKLLS